jgi:acetolactate synthase-1/2/3 large subunit
VVTSTGVGAANAAGPLLEAFVASSPAIHITGQVDAAYVDGDRGFPHGAKDQLGMLDRIDKAAFRAARTEEIQAHVEPIALPGPKPPDAAPLASAAELIRQARRPLIRAGGGTIASGASEALTNLAERTRTARR